ncbi:MAG TPA: contact-dependent growth inhibition system immunity protein [Candidatus Baltobacteraceae bacterium]|jgi:hypothetical protein|nr:contact-dependent growth inhibition system immunity protein [Candidatus Baltobacteraceae bacterium]
MSANNDNPSVADLAGPWADSDSESGLILRCKAAWNKPLRELTNKELATFLQQRIAVIHILPVAKNRIENKVADGTEFYEGELKEAIEAVTQADDRQHPN